MASVNSGEPDKKRVPKAELLDINSSNFDANVYIQKLLKDYNLTQLMEKEQVLYKQIQRLDSEMQTLVYENYNKFISATETVKKMSNNFDQMEEQLKSLADSMDNITESSEKISASLRSRRQDLAKLTSTHSVLKKLQFLFELPPNMKRSLDNKSYNEAVKLYLHAQRALEQYRHLPSIAAIDNECNATLNELKGRLREQLANKEIGSKMLTESVQLLLQLHEPAEELGEQYLAICNQKLEDNLGELDHQVNMCRSFLAKDDDTIDLHSVMDVLEFVDLACNGFLASLSLIIVSYNKIFMESHDRSAKGIDPRDNESPQLIKFVREQLAKLYERIETRFNLEAKAMTDSSIYVRALDRFYRRLESLNKVFPHDLDEDGMRIALKASNERVESLLQHLKNRFNEELITIRHSIISSSNYGNEASAASESLDQSNGKPTQLLSEALIKLETSVSEQLKAAIGSLSGFVHSDVTFCLKGQFITNFTAKLVREHLIVNFIRYLISTAAGYEKTSTSSVPPSQLVLLLSRFCLDLSNSIIGYLLAFTQEQLMIDPKVVGTSVSDLSSEAKTAAQDLVNYFVRKEGQSISQMIRKSVETRDWLSSVEPRAVRSVMKRIVEDVAALDAQVGQLYEEGTRSERSSESSRSRRLLGGGAYPRPPLRSPNWGSYANTTFENSLMSNIQKLFSEKIEIFTPVVFSKLSMVTGIIKIALKTFLECVRLCTFSKFGLQQVQIDAYYLQVHLWRFVSDEKIVYDLLDEVLVSTAHRCLDPQLMEMNMVEKICEGT